MSGYPSPGSQASLKAVRTYIASGNVVLESEKTEAAVKASLEATLRSYAGKSVGVLVRTAGELAEQEILSRRRLGT